ncbi:MAG: hypothetical protein NT027_17235 [Proteobacteria bacterium]|nr:hypothetical protein [Pseudomonadota bacterium]
MTPVLVDSLVAPNDVKDSSETEIAAPHGFKSLPDPDHFIKPKILWTSALVIVGFLLLMALVLFLLDKKRRRLAGAVPLSSEELLAVKYQKVQTLLSLPDNIEKPSERASFSEEDIASEFSLVLREIFSKVLKIQFQEKTTEEIMSIVPTIVWNVRQAKAEDFLVLLTEADRVRFAGGLLTEDVRKRWRDVVERVWNEYQFASLGGANATSKP